jgi:DNA-binding transcriptional MerR regulator
MPMNLLAPRDAAKRLKLSTSRIQQLDREGVLPALRDSAGRRLYEVETVELFAQQREQKRAPTPQAQNDAQPVTP